MVNHQSNMDMQAHAQIWLEPRHACGATLFAEEDPIREWRMPEGSMTYLVKHFPDGGAGLVNGGNDSVTKAGQVAHVLHHVQRCKAVQPCADMPIKSARSQRALRLLTQRRYAQSLQPPRKGNINKANLHTRPARTLNFYQHFFCVLTRSGCHLL